MLRQLPAARLLPAGWMLVGCVVQGAVQACMCGLGDEGRWWDVLCPALCKLDSVGCRGDVGGVRLAQVLGRHLAMCAACPLHPSSFNSTLLPRSSHPPLRGAYAFSTAVLFCEAATL